MTQSKKAFIIAEAGVNHNGSIELARELVDAAISAGADAVKFQSFIASAIVTANASKAEYQIANTGSSESQLKMLQSLELSQQQQREVYEYCQSRGIQFLSTPFDSASLKFLTKNLGLKTIKIGSGELTNAPWRYFAHIHGGEITSGAFDDSIRHAITKMSSLHFVAADEYARRVVQLGEQPSSVFNVGSLGVENALASKLLNKSDLSKALNVELESPILLVTYHPTTRSTMSVTEEIDQVLSALENFSYCTIVFTGVNADPGNAEVSTRIAKFVQSDPKLRSLHASLGQNKYLSLLNLCDVVIGNSSSGIIEAPAFGKPTVNIGNRQDGRLRASSIIDVGVAKQEIQTAIETALSPTWRERCAKTVSSYKSSNTAQLIADTLKNEELNLHKTFFDIK